MSVVTIIGSGMMGSALAFPARENGNEVRLVGTHLDREIIDGCIKTGRHPKFDRDFPEGIKYYQTESTKEAVKGADLVIGGVSSFGVEWFADYVLPLLPEGMRVLTVTKGLMDMPDGTLLTYPDIWQKKLSGMGKKLSLNAVGGPCTSYELVAHDQTEVAFCGDSMEDLLFIRELIQTDYYHVSLTTDIKGIESAVALKNGYALGIALTIGANQAREQDENAIRFNSQAAVFGQAAKEMEKLLELQGAADRNSLWVGLGDLYVTVYGGRTRLIGILLGRGMDIDAAKARLKGVTLESLVVAERVARAVRKKAKAGLCREDEFPLLMHVDDILHHSPVNIPWDDFRYIRQ